MIRLLPVVLAGAAWGSPVLAEPPAWTGVWAAEPEWCRYAGQIGSHNPAPILITGTTVEGLENFCDITRVRGNDGYRYWELALTCHAEGDHYEETTLLMLEDENTLWRWFGAGAPLRFTRCEEGA